MGRLRWCVAVGIVCALGLTGCTSETCMDPQPVPPCQPTESRGNTGGSTSVGGSGADNTSGTGGSTAAGGGSGLGLGGDASAPQNGSGGAASADAASIPPNAADATAAHDAGAGSPDAGFVDGANTNEGAVSPSDDGVGEQTDQDDAGSMATH